MSDRPLHYVMYTARYTVKWGGVMALHTLAEVLNKSGASASLWYFDTPFLPQDRLIAYLRRAYHPLRNRRTESLPESVRSPYTTAVARRKDVENAVVIYPEIVDGNPLNAKRVVRWFLNKPGRMTGRINFGHDELYFVFQEIFDDPEINPRPDHKLTLVTVLSNVFQQRNFGPRSGTCYIIRKGESRAPDRTLLDVPIIDQLSHEEIAEIFNRSEFCVSYDPQTFYSYFAAMCGCKSVVIPEAFFQRAT